MNSKSSNEWYIVVYLHALPKEPKQVLKVPQGRLHTLFLSQILLEQLFSTLTLNVTSKLHQTLSQVHHFWFGQKKGQIEYFFSFTFSMLLFFFEVSHVFFVSRETNRVFLVFPPFAGLRRREASSAANSESEVKGLKHGGKIQPFFGKMQLMAEILHQFIPLFTRFDKSQVVQDFFHQQ